MTLPHHFPTITPKQANAILEHTRLRDVRLNRKRLTRLTECAPKELIIRAIYRAQQDAGALQFLENLFKQVGILAQDSSQQYPLPLENAERKKTHYSWHVYGGKYALCFEVDETRGSEHTPPRPTVALDAAPKVEGSQRIRWDDKVRVQLTLVELPSVLGVLLGLTERCEFKGHGPDHNKGFSFENQYYDGVRSVFARVFMAEKPVHAVPIGPADLFYVQGLLIRQFRAMQPWLSAEGVILLARSFASRVNSQ